MALLKINMLLWSATRSCVSEFFAICRFALMKAVQLRLSVLEVFFFFCIFIHKHKVKGSFAVLFVYFLEEEMCRFFFFFFFDDRNWSATEENAVTHIVVS